MLLTLNLQVLLLPYLVPDLGICINLLANFLKDVNCFEIMFIVEHRSHTIMY